MLSKEVGQDSPENVSQNVIKQNLCILIPNCVVKVRRTGRAREAQPRNFFHGSRILIRSIFLLLVKIVSLYSNIYF